MSQLTVGAKLPEAKLLLAGANGVETIDLTERAKGRKLVIFAVPGAFTGTCSTAHAPSFIRTKGKFDAKGVDEVICVSVNDPFVMKAWGENTGATAAGLTFLADSDGSFTKAMGFDFDIPVPGMTGRSKRYALLADDGVITVLQAEENSGQCTVSGGEALLEAI